jgi:hypothetical protein
MSKHSYMVSAFYNLFVCGRHWAAFSCFQRSESNVRKTFRMCSFPLWQPGFTSVKSMWGLWWTKWHWGSFSPSTSDSPANHHSTSFSIIITTWGLAQ